MSAENKWEIWQLHEDGIDAGAIARITGWPVAIVRKVIEEFSRL